MDNDIIIDESLKKELPTDDPNAMYNRKRAVELAPVQKLTKHQQRQLRKKNLLEAPKSKASEKKEKKKEARRKTLEKYNRRDTVLEQISKVTISEESSSLITPTSSLGTKQSKRRRYEEALKRKQMGLSYDQNIIDSVEKKMSLSKIEAAREEGWNVSDDSSDAEDKITQPTEELKEPPQLFTPLIKIAEEKPKTSDETKNEEIQPEVHPEPRLAINVPLNRPEGVDEIRSKLPIIGEEQTIVEKIHENDVVILCGETGSGKTTQIPQFLYEAGYGTLRTHGKIVVTEPRKVAAINMSKRVAYETGLPWGQKVGYQVRNNKYYTDSTVIKFCTDGILLREAEEDLLLSKYSVVIIDEAHERTVNTDVLIGLLSRIVVLRRERVEKGESNIEKLKLIIMSATLRVDDFLKNKRLFEIEPPLINIDARQYDVQVHFSRNTPAIEKRLDTVKHCVEMIHERMPPGGILVFLPGKNEIKECVSYFSKLYSKERVSSNRPNKSNTKKHTEAENTEDKSTEQIEIEDVDEIMDLNQKIEIIDKKPMIVLPLYSLLSQEEQAFIFKEISTSIKKSYRTSLYYYKLAAKKGYAKAQNNCGRLYELGLGVSKPNKELAVSLYKKAADQGNVIALHNYARALEKGIGIQKDEAKSASIYKKLADDDPDDGLAQYNYARMCHNGIGLAENLEEAGKYYLLAIDNNIAEAKQNYGVMLFNKFHKWNEAAKFFEMAVSGNGGQPSAKYNYAQLLKRGMGLNEDKKKAESLLHDAAEELFLPAIVAYAELLKNKGEEEETENEYNEEEEEEESESGNKDPNEMGDIDRLLSFNMNKKCPNSNLEKAAAYYKKAAEMEISDRKFLVPQRNAQFDLAMMYKNGKGVAKDNELFVKYLTLAAKNKHPDAESLAEDMNLL